MTRLCFLAFVVACSHSDAPPPAEPAPVAAVPAADPAPCPDVAAQAVKLMPGSDQIKPIVESHCADDRWSAELRKCVLLAKSRAELEPCRAYFTGTQFETLQRDLDAVKTADTSPAAPTKSSQPATPAPAAPDVPPPANAMPK